MSEPRTFFFEQIPVGSYKNFAYLVVDMETKEAAAFDPAWEISALMGRLTRNNFQLRYIINTHAHFDHIEGNPKLSASTGAKIVMHEASLGRKDIAVKDNDSLKLGKQVLLRFVHTPGHSPESMCIVVNDSLLITGDTLFVGECGRVDLPGGDASQLYDSFEKLRNLNPALKVCPGHDYGPTTMSTLKEQIETNYTLAKRTREEFIKFMNEP